MCDFYCILYSHFPLPFSVFASPFIILCVNICLYHIHMFISSFIIFCVAISLMPPFIIFCVDISLILSVVFIFLVSPFMILCVAISLMLSAHMLWLIAVKLDITELLIFSHLQGTSMGHLSSVPSRARCQAPPTHLTSSHNPTNPAHQLTLPTEHSSSKEQHLNSACRMMRFALSSIACLFPVTLGKYAQKSPMYKPQPS